MGNLLVLVAEGGCNDERPLPAVGCAILEILAVAGLDAVVFAFGVVGGRCTLDSCSAGLGGEWRGE